MSTPIIKSIRTEEGDCLIDYNSLANRPTNLLSLEDKGVANGIATLDKNGKIPSSQLPSVESTDYVPIAEKGVSNGVATLDNDGKVPSTQLPSMNYVSLNEKGAKNGVAPLNKELKIDKSIAIIGIYDETFLMEIKMSLEDGDIRILRIFDFL